MFVSVDRNTYNENINITLTKKYLKEDHNRMIEIEPYLYTENGH